MSAHRFLNYICGIGMFVVVVALTYWVFYWDIQAFLTQLNTMDWSVL